MYLIRWLYLPILEKWSQVGSILWGPEVHAPLVSRDACCGVLSAQACGPLCCGELTAVGSLAGRAGPQPSELPGPSRVEAAGCWLVGPCPPLPYPMTAGQKAL